MEETEDDFEPYDHRDKPVEKLAKTWQTYMHFMKGQVGTGILAMHVAFSNTGTLVGIIATVLLSAISLYAMHLLIRSLYLLCKKKRVGLLTYSEAMEYALQIGPEKTRKFSRAGYYTVDIFIIIYQTGGPACYVLFIASNTKQFVEAYADIKWDVRVYCCVIVLPVLVLNMLRNLRILAPFSLLANCVTILGLGLILSFVFKDMPAFSSRPTHVEVTRFPMFIGTLLFALITIGLITTLENNMLKPADYIKPLGVLNIGYFIIMILYMTVGLFGYIKYGYKDKLEGSITLELPQDDLLAQSVKLLFALAITITHPVQCYAVVEIIMDKYLKPQKNPVLTEYILRICVVFTTLILAVAIPMLGQFISLLGAFCMSVMAFIFPPFMDTYARWPDKLGKHNWKITKNILIMIFGLIVMCLGTFSCVADIIAEFNKQK